jgi:hypothetical protein
MCGIAGFLTAASKEPGRSIDEIAEAMWVSLRRTGPQ